MSKSYERARRRKQQKMWKIPTKSNYLKFSITERKILAYRYFFSISDENLLRAQEGVENLLPVLFIGILFKNGTKKGHIINDLLTSSVWSLQGNLRPRPSLSLLQYIKPSVWDFPIMTSLLVNKWYACTTILGGWEKLYEPIYTNTHCLLSRLLNIPQISIIPRVS